MHFMLVRVASDGSSGCFEVKDWESQSANECSGGTCNGATTGGLPNLSHVQLITNADRGVLFKRERRGRQMGQGLQPTAWWRLQAVASPRLRSRA